MPKIRLGVFYGGRSCEHDVSIITGHQAMENADRDKYDIVPVYMDAQGAFHTGMGLMDIGVHGRFAEAKDVLPCVLERMGGDVALIAPPKEGFFKGVKRLFTLDAALLCLHGMNGEDGTLQGMLELLNLPYTSAGVMGSAIGMDKITMKAVLRGNGMPVSPFCWFDRDDWEKDREAAIRSVEAAVTYPIFVKPANLGSSIGITKAKDRAELDAAIDVALCFDRRVLCEQGVSNAMELNCAAAGYGADVIVSEIEEPVGWEDFLTFDDKYLSGGKGADKGTGGASGGAGMETLKRKLPAEISRELSKQIKKTTEDIFRVFNLKGAVRVDYLLDRESGALYVNEPNTIPGSLAFYLFEAAGVSFSALIDRMVDGALRAQRDKEWLTYSYNSALLKQVNAGRGAKQGG